MQNDLLSELRDIHGIDAVSWWPLAPGWWGVLFLMLAILIGVFVYKEYKKRKVAHWQSSIKSVFATLRNEQSAKKKASAISELLRRLAIRQYGRKSCAGLEGQTWLEWLSQNDPAGFNWQQDGKILIEAPYAPERSLSLNDMEPLIKAAEKWVK